LTERDGALSIRRTQITQRDGDRVFRIPALCADVLDTTGAGDCFCGAFMAALVHGGDLQAAARAGTVAASIAIEGYGAEPMFLATPQDAARRMTAMPADRWRTQSGLP